MTRHNGRAPRKLRPIKITRHYTKNPAGSVLIQTGETRVLCTACFEEGVPKWREKSGLGWVTAEYDMLPGATSTRKRRNRERIDGRTQEIQRLIGRCLRSVIDMSLLGKNTIMIDCDVLQADGGTRTASITGGFVALYDAVRFGIKKKLIAKNAIFDHVAAV
ncbi:MAG: ribonuclease PH, partial [Planctomycetes bacterium]|nr:ribonuclease PH [Planctomycetota bacterium]